MKKFLAIAIVAVAFTACNNSAEETKAAADSAVKSVDSTVNAAADSAKSAIDSTVKSVDSTAKAAVDSLKK